MAPFDDHIQVPNFLLSTVTMAISCVISKMRQDTDQKLWLSYPTLIQRQQYGGTVAKPA